MYHEDMIKNKTFLVVTSIVIVIFASTAYLLLARSDMSPIGKSEMKNTSEQKAETKNIAGTDETESAPASNSGEYLEYTEQLFNEKRETTRLLFFHATWCPQCRKLDEDITRSTITNGVTIFKVDYDSSQELREKYGVTLQTTVVRVNQEGNKMSSFVAYDNPTYQTIKDELL